MIKDLLSGNMKTLHWDGNTVSSVTHSRGWGKEERFFMEVCMGDYKCEAVMFFS